MSSFLIWGSELSPFALKLRALCAFAQVPHVWLPDAGSRWQNLRVNAAIELGKRRGTILRFPAMDRLDEYPLVPYLVEPGGRIQVDTSAIARWFDARHPAPAGPFFPADPVTGWVAAFLDEAFDELGLYLVHHNRWVLSATTNDAGTRLAHEQRRVLPPGMGPRFARWFAERQVRRLPYLFSVAPPGYTVPGLEPGLTPPSRPGFPPTHDLLDGIWRDVLAVLEALLATRPWILGERFTIADASVYGQLAMNLKDPTANDELAARAPRTHAWLRGIRAGAHASPRGPVAVDGRLEPLLALLGATFVPLMRQNERAWAAARAAGQTRFNEAAFDRGEALYDGTLRGHPFRSVAKTFQVRVWRDLRDSWRTLDRAQRDTLADLGLVADGFAAAAS